jgi:hypothetical protein
MPKYEPTQLTTLRLRDLPAGRNAGVEIPTGMESWSLLADSYKEGADELTKLAGISRSYARLGAPIMFLYRHYIELQLKSLLIDAGELLDEPQDVPPRHYLATLWQRVRTLLLRVSPNSDGEYFIRADQIVADFDSIDPTSFTFRYPVNKVGEPSTECDLYVDPRVARQMIAELDILLSGADAMISEYVGLKDEGY